MSKEIIWERQIEAFLDAKLSQRRRLLEERDVIDLEIKNLTVLKNCLTRQIHNLTQSNAETIRRIRNEHRKL